MMSNHLANSSKSRKSPQSSYYDVRLEASGEHFLRLHAHDSGLLSIMHNFPFNSCVWHFKGSSFHPDGNRMVAWNERGQVFFFNMRENEYFIVKSSSHGIDYCTFINTHKHDEMHVIIAHSSGLVAIQDVQRRDTILGKLEFTASVSSVTDRIIFVRTNPCKAQCIIVSSNGSVTLWNLKKCKLLGMLDVREGIVDVSYDCHGSLISVVLEWSGIYWYDASTFAIVRHFKLPASDLGIGLSNPIRFTAYCCTYLSRNSSKLTTTTEIFDEEVHWEDIAGCTYDVCLLLSDDSRQIFQWIATAVVNVKMGKVVISTAEKLLSIMKIPSSIQSIVCMKVFDDESHPMGTIDDSYVFTGLNDDTIDTSDVYGSGVNELSSKFKSPRTAFVKVVLLSSTGGMFVLQGFDIDWNSPGTFFVIADVSSDLMHGDNKSHFSTLRELLYPRAIPIIISREVIGRSLADLDLGIGRECMDKDKYSKANRLGAMSVKLLLSKTKNATKDDVLINSLHFRFSSLSVGKYYLATLGMDGTIKIFDKVTMIGFGIESSSYSGKRTRLTKRLPSRSLELSAVLMESNLNNCYKRGQCKSNKMRDEIFASKCESDEAQGDWPITANKEEGDKETNGNQDDVCVKAELDRNIHHVGFLSEKFDDVGGRSPIDPSLLSSSRPAVAVTIGRIEHELVVDLNELVGWRWKSWSGSHRNEYISKLKQDYGNKSELPSDRRALVWRFLLDIDDNKHAYERLCGKGVHPSFEGMEIMYPIKSKEVLLRLQRICSCITYWSEIYGLVNYLPTFVFPFLIVLIDEDEVCSFEVCSAMLLAWGATWNTNVPNAPGHVIRLINLILEFLDPLLYNHIHLNGASAGELAWQLMNSAFSEVLEADKWLFLMDHLLLHLASHPNRYYICALAVLRACSTDILLCTDADQIRSCMRNQHHDIAIADLVLDMQFILGSLPVQLLSKSNK